MRALSGLDAAFLSLETDTARLCVGAVVVLDPPEGRRSLFSPSTRFAQIRHMIEQRVHLVGPFRQRVVRMPFDLHHPVWVDDGEFNLDDHVRRASLPAPGGARELDDFVAELMSRPLDPGRPLWEMVVVEGLESGRTALVAKLHHAILDGVSGASMLASFLDLSARDRRVVPPDPWDPEPPPRAGDVLRHVATGVVQRSTAALDALGAGAAALGNAQRASRASGETTPGAPRPPRLFSAPRSSINGTISSRRRYASTSLALDDVEVVRRALRATSNDVVLGVVAGAIRRLLEGRSDLPDRSLIALVPVSTRRRGDAATLGNRVSGMLVPLRTEVSDPRARLTAIAEYTRAAKARHLATRRMLYDVAQLSPSFAVSRAVRWAGGLRLFDRVPPPFNVVVSFVPCPATPLWCAGSRVIALYPVGPVAEGIGLNVTAFSYMGRLSFGLLGCRRLVPEVQDLAIMVDDALNELVASVGAAHPLPAAG